MLSLKQLTNLGENKVFRSRPRVSMLVVSFANFKFRALSRYPTGDRLMPRSKVHVIAQASHGHNTVLSHRNRAQMVEQGTNSEA